MSGSAAVDVLIGLVLIFFIFSLMCTGIREWISGIFATRAQFLEKGIMALLSDSAKAKEFFDHPMIKNLITRNGRISRLLTRRQEKKPSYLQAKTFAVALIDTVAPNAMAKERERIIDPHAVSKAQVFDEVDTALNSLPSELQRTLRAHLNEAKGDLDAFRRNIEDWFDNGMDRVSGWYRRRSHLVLWAIAIALVGSLNIDTIAIASTLWSNRTVRDALVAQAQEATKGNSSGPCIRAGSKGNTGADLSKAAECVKGLEELKLPIGWGSTPANGNGFIELLKKFAGLLITAAALTLGAPFWFGWLTKLGGFRTAGNPPPKSSVAPQ
jgi:hypothetical protein